MTPSRFQAPGRPLSASQIASGGPPATSTFWSLWSAKNARKRLSGDQNGNVAPSVPVSRRAATSPRGWTHRTLFPLASFVANVAMRPSGESDSEPHASPSTANSTFSGGSRNDRMRSARTGARRRYPAAARPAATIAAAATAQASLSRFLRLATTGAGSPACEPPSAIHWSCSFTSCAVWKRSSGSFARQVFTTRFRAGGIIGEISEIAGGSSRRIEPMSDAWLDPVNAFLPVAIS